jgi:hypothetical protein
MYVGSVRQALSTTVRVGRRCRCASVWCCRVPSMSLPQIPKCPSTVRRVSNHRLSCVQSLSVAFVVSLAWIQPCVFRVQRESNVAAVVTMQLVRQIPESLSTV